MELSANGYAFLKANEVGPRGLPLLVVEGDTGGKQQIGYGHDLLPGETYPNGIDEHYAETLLYDDVQKWQTVLDALIPESCTQNQYDALIDFTHECGLGALRQLLSHGWEQVPIQLKRWVFAHVKGHLMELASMVERRQKEITLFTT